MNTSDRGSPMRHRPVQSRIRAIGSLTAIAAVAVVLAACGSSGGAAPAAATGPALKPTQLVSAAQADLKKLKEPATVLGDFTGQLNIPQSWITQAKTEGKVSIETDQHPDITNIIKQAFEERYPYINATFTYGSTSATRSQALAGFKQGKNVADVIGGITATLQDFEKAGALAKVNDLPVWQQIPTNAKDNQGYWIGYATKFWGIGYNTNDVKPSQLPKTWQALTTSPLLAKSGTLGIADKPELFVYQLAQTYGTQFAADFSKQLFALKPEQRSEGQNALPQLIANGTVPVILPTASYTIDTLAKTGAPVSWYTPQPAISNPSDLEIMSDATDPSAAKIFVNWMASAEGELVAAVAEDISPVQASLSNISALYPYASQVVGKTWQYISPAKETGVAAVIDPIWKASWGK
jgi:ABC-type Fe3+ transport system substrate-binding protein